MVSLDAPTVRSTLTDTTLPEDAVSQLLEVVQQLSLVRTLEDVQRIVRTSARALTGADGTTFVLRDGAMCFYADEDAIAPLWKGSRFPMETCISGWAMLNGTAAVIPDIYADERIPHSAYLPTFVKSLVMVPIRRLDPVGAIGIYWSRQRHPSEHEVAVLQALADSTSIAMEHVRGFAELDRRVRDRTAALEAANEEIRRLSLTDELTGLYNRRGFFESAEAALRAARERGSGCALVFLDVDGLKQVNDGAGHDAGDGLIIDVARILRATFRSPAVVARFGGDEFCIFASDAPNDPDVLRDRLFDAFGRFNAAAERRYRISASVGLVGIPPSDTTSLAALLVRADELMYADKRRKLAD